MSFRRMLAPVACAAFLGLAASGLVRANLSGIMSALVEIPFQASLSDPPSQFVDPTPPEIEGIPENSQIGLRNEPERATRAKRGQLARSARSAPARGSDRDAFAQGLAKGIRKLGEGRYEIKRATLEMALGNLAGVANMVRVSPEVRGGKALGFRLSAMPEDGPFAKLGLRNGDVLVAVNGLTVASLDQALEVYRKLRTARHLVLGLVREGHEVTQDYAIR